MKTAKLPVYRNIAVSV